MKTYVTGTELAVALKEAGDRSVWVEVETSLFAGLMGHRFVGPDGRVVSMEQATVYRAENGVLVAEPLIIRQDA